MLELSDILNYTGEDPDDYFGSVAPPLIMASNFRFHNVKEFREAILNEKDHLIYSRGNHPKVEKVYYPPQISFNLIRLSIGLEDPGLLMADIDRCL